MDQVLYPFDPARDHYKSFAWVLELASKIMAKVLVLGNVKDFDSSTSRDNLNQMVLELYSFYLTYYCCGVEHKQIPIKTKLDRGDWPDIIWNTLSNKGIDIIVLHSESTLIFNPDITWKQSCIRLSENNEFGGFSTKTDMDLGSRLKNRAFYSVYHQAQKEHLSKKLLLKIAADPGVFNYLADYYRNN